MAWSGRTARDLSRHQDGCERASEEARREARETAVETRRQLERIQDLVATGLTKLEASILRLEDRTESRHAENKADNRALWRTMWAGLAAILTASLAVIGFMATHGGLAHLMKDIS